MWKFGAIAAGIAAVTLMGSGVTTAGAGAGATTETIRLSEKAVEFTVLDLGEPGLGFGDVFVARGRLFDGGDQRVGFDGSTCTQTSASGQAHCALILHLPGGQITGQGLIRSAHIPFVATMAVTGGTGAFADVGGQIRLEQVSQEEADLEVRLIHLVGT